VSALGGSGQAAQDLIDAIKGLSREFSTAGQQARSNQMALSGFQPGNIGAMVGGTLGGPVGAMAGEALGNNVFVNTAMKAGRDFSNDVFNNVAGDFAKYGGNFGNSFSESFRQSTLRAEENIPFFGDVAAEVTGVQRSAKARLKGLTDAAARGGATFTEEELKPVAEYFQAEEGRATQNSKLIDKLFQKDDLVKQAEDTSPRFKELQGTVDQLNAALNNLSVGFATFNNFLDAVLGRSQR